MKQIGSFGVLVLGSFWMVPCRRRKKPANTMQPPATLIAPATPAVVGQVKELDHSSTTKT